MIQLHLGDCLDVLRSLPDGSVDAVVTSPPYNLGAAPNATKKPRRGPGHWEWGGYASYRDAMPEADYQAWQLSVLSELHRVCRDGSSVFNVHKDRTWGGRSISPREWLERSPFLIRQQIAWDRCGSIEHSGWYFYSQNEWVFWLTKGERVQNIGRNAAHSTVWRVPPAQGTGHPATFPVPLAERCVQAAMAPGGTVLDPFMGSGTTGVACVRTGRNFIGCEIDPAYFEIARSRIEAAQPELCSA